MAVVGKNIAVIDDPTWPTWNNWWIACVHEVILHNLLISKGRMGNTYKGHFPLC